MGWIDDIGWNIAERLIPDPEAQDTPYIQAGRSMQQQVVGGTDYNYNDQGRLVNKKGQFVNNQGQLVDKEGDVINTTNYSQNITLADINKEFTTDNSTNTTTNVEESNGNQFDISNPATSIVDMIQGHLNTNSSDVNTDDFDTTYDGKYNTTKVVQKKRPFKSLFGKMKKNWQEREGGLRNIGSAQFDEEAFFNEGQVDDNGVSLEKPNPNYGKLKRDPNDSTKTLKGKGLFGKEGGFMSKFGTGRGAMSGLLGASGDAISQMGMDMMSEGSYQYGDFYDRGDE
jgi:hypothetical protein